MEENIPSGNSRTITITEGVPAGIASDKRVLRLTLTGKPDPRVKWSQDTIDNENMGKKSSKRQYTYNLRLRIICMLTNIFFVAGCCIFHKQKAFGESDSDETDSDTEKRTKDKPLMGKPKNYQRFHA